MHGCKAFNVVNPKAQLAFNRGEVGKPFCPVLRRSGTNKTWSYSTGLVAHLAYPKLNKDMDPFYRLPFPYNAELSYFVLFCCDFSGDHITVAMNESIVGAESLALDERVSMV